MKLQYDPAEGPAFWQAIERLPGYPAGEHMPIPIMLFESDAVYKLPDVLKRAKGDPAKPVLMVMDNTPMSRQGKDLKELVQQVLASAGWRVEPVVMQPDTTGQVHTDMPHIEAVKQHIREGMTLLAVGSGTVCDITKHASYLCEKETGTRSNLVVFQTANSVSAFTSNMAPTFVDGVKRTLASRYPDALVCDMETLADAPYEMTAAGVGDLLAAFVSLPDWYLANQLGMDDSYSELAQDLMGPLDTIFRESAQSIRDRSPEGMAVLAKMIALGGLAMSLSHATTPMSGYEHVMSHILDLLAEAAAQPLAQHGSQVALTTLLAAEAYQRFMQEFDASEVNVDACYPDPAAMSARIRQVFLQVDPSGKAGEECWADYRLKLEAWHAQRPRFEQFLKTWPEIQPKLAAWTRTPKDILDIIQATGGPLTFRGLVPPKSKEQALFAFLSAPLMRKRLTVGDMFIFLNWDREDLWAKVWKGAQPGA
ncbi:MAG TPA: iron-containing alcohol dehydrogenase [Anaerolineales bacterium]|nr:iron-containing alcohol dehydrogenase [Anaerolineales bacterium]